MLGRFAAAEVETLSESDLTAFEALLEESDNDIYAWLTAKEPPPARHDNALMAALIRFNDPK